MGQVTSILVEYKNVEGWHVFSSPDMVGLYVASKEAEVAYNDVSVAIQKLMRLNSGVEVQVTPALSFCDFMRSIRAEEAAVEAPIEMASRRYEVRAMARAA